MPRAIVIRTAGTNCDAELVRAFILAGADTDLVHLDRLIECPSRLDGYDIIGFPGGFSYGDDIASGRIFAMRARRGLYPALRSAALRGCPMIGICNGFQILVQTGLLPGPADGRAWPEAEPPPQEASLAANATGMFTDQWVRVRIDAESPCIWTQPLVGTPDPDRLLRLPVAHGEGRFVTRDPDVLERLSRSHQIPLRYVDNPNGSTDDIAGICDATGRIFGLMPHPERYTQWTHHPFWTRLDPPGRAGDTPGMKMFAGAVRAAQLAGA